MEKKDINTRQSRFSDAAWYQAGPQSIIVGGAGGIGSWVALFLGRIGHELYIYDDDTIDETNMAGQLYSTAQIGVNKALATANNVQAFCGITPQVLGRYTEEDGYANPIMFSCFDNMAARKLMFEKWAAQEEREVFVDGRMLAEVGMVFVVQKGQEDLYRSELFADEEVEEAPCSFKATSHCGAFIASVMVAGFNNYIANKFRGGEFSIVQFRTDFELPLLTLENVNVVLPTPVVAEEVVEEKEVEDVEVSSTN